MENTGTLKMIGGIILGLGVSITVGFLTDELGLGIALGLPLGIGLGYFLKGESK
mgnify:CR=1 FL=1